AVNNLNQPILTINAPIGLGLRDNPGDIVVNGNPNVIEPFKLAQLSVLEDQSINLIGGNLDFNDARISAPGGNVTLAALEAAGIVNINENGNLNLPANLTRGNISLDNSGVSVVGDSNNGEGGSINLDGNNIELLNRSNLVSGIEANSGFAEAQAGNINLNATGTINLNGQSVIQNVVGSGAEGNSGNVEITTANLSLVNGAIATTTFGEGDSGDVLVNASESITLDGVTPNDQLGGGIFNFVGQGAVGNVGNIQVTTANLAILNGAVIDAGTLGEGDGGTVSVNASESITLDGTTPDGQLRSGIASEVAPGARGNGGDIELTTANLSISNGAGISASTFGEGDSGDVLVNASESITLDGTTPDGQSNSGIASEVEAGARGNGGDIEVITANLSISSGASISGGTLG
ncbi:MAG: filamentous hemagglutinin N-terminal domain-containing protein, partial [Waterburya sp.]